MKIIKVYKDLYANKKLIPSLEALKVALPYFILGCLWIALSDKLLSYLITDLERFLTFGYYKGWFYVAVTAVLVYLLVADLIRRLKIHQDHLDDLVVERTKDYEWAMQEAEKSKELLYKSSRSMRFILDSTRDGIYMIDRNGTIQNLNTAMALRENKTIDSMIGTNISEHMPREIYEKRVPQLLSVFQTGQVETYQDERNGIWAEIRAYPIVEEDGSINSIAIFSADITDKKRTELELIRAKHDSNAANRAKSEFLSRMSHEIRTPLNSIIGLTHVSSQTRDIEKLMDYLTKIDLSSKHLLNIINDILDISRIEAGKMAVSPVEFDLVAAIEEIMNIMLPKFDEKKQNVDFYIDKSIPQTLKSDPIRLKQVLMNLLSNANKFTPRQGSIGIRVNIVNRIGNEVLVEFSVKDNGIGIKKDQIHRLFNPFEQADGSFSREFEGTGLGLAISRSIVELMGGKIHVISEEGKGSDFLFVLPFEIAAVGVSKPKISFEELKVLVVDDELETCDYMKSLLSEFNVNASVVQTGQKAIAEALEGIAEGKPYNVVFVDWRMPGMNGIETARQIKRICGDETMVIMISMYEWNEIESEAREAGISMFLPKPIFPSRLLNTLYEITNGPLKITSVLQANDKDLFLGKRILVAEDMQINQLIVKEMLSESGAQIVPAADGQEALHAFLSSEMPFDAILMDIQMPNMDGYETTRRIRSSNVKNAKTVGIIAMTANVFKEDIDKAMMAGIDDHIGKPIDYKDLILKIRKSMN